MWIIEVLVWDPICNRFARPTDWTCGSVRPLPEKEARALTAELPIDRRYRGMGLALHGVRVVEVC